MQKHSRWVKEATPWRVALTPNVEKAVLRNRKNLTLLLNSFAKILYHPYHGPDIEPIKGERDRYRIKVNGRLRLIYEIRRDDRTIYLMALGHRDDIYSMV